MRLQPEKKVCLPHSFPPPKSEPDRGLSKFKNNFSGFSMGVGRGGGGGRKENVCV